MIAAAGDRERGDKSLDDTMMYDDWCEAQGATLLHLTRKY